MAQGDDLGQESGRDSIQQNDTKRKRCVELRPLQHSIR
jgi:hypothetical protein